MSLIQYLPLAMVVAAIALRLHLAGQVDSAVAANRAFRQSPTPDLPAEKTPHHPALRPAPQAVAAALAA